VIASGVRRLLSAALALLTACGGGAPPRLELTGTGGGERGGETAPAVAAPNVVRAALAGGEVATITYELRNSGGRALLLHGVTTDCGCDLVAPPPDAIAPRARTRLAVACRAPLGSGRAWRTTRLFSNDPRRPELSLLVELATTGSEAQPPGLYFGYVAVGRSAVQRLALPIPAGRTGGRAEPPPVPRAGDPAVTVEPGVDEGGRRVHLVRFTPRAPGPFHAALDLGPGAPAVPLSGVGFGDVVVVPAELTLPPASDSAVSATVVLTNLGDAPLVVTGIDFPTGLSGELQTTVPGRELHLVVRARGGRGPIDAPIRLRTGSPDEPALIVPVKRAEA
jgi:hypothetical protein